MCRSFFVSFDRIHQTKSKFFLSFVCHRQCILISFNTPCRRLSIRALSWSVAMANVFKPAHTPGIWSPNEVAALTIVDAFFNNMDMDIPSAVTFADNLAAFFNISENTVRLFFFGHRVYACVWH